MAKQPEPPAILSAASFIATLDRAIGYGEDEERREILTAHDAALRALAAQLAGLLEKRRYSCPQKDVSCPECIEVRDLLAAAYKAGLFDGGPREAKG